MTSIQVVIAPQIAAGVQYVAVRFTNAQSIALQATNADAWVAYSEGGLTLETTRFKLSQYDTPDGTGSSGLVLTFPLKPYTGTLWFASASGSTDSKIHVWTVSCGSNGQY
jgi:hypothetical protein